MCHLDLEAAKTITEEGARISSEDSNPIQASNSHVCCQKQKMANHQLNSARAQKETHLPPLPCPRPRMKPETCPFRVRQDRPQNREPENQRRMPGWAKLELLRRKLCSHFQGKYRGARPDWLW